MVTWRRQAGTVTGTMVPRFACSELPHVTTILQWVAVSQADSQRARLVTMDASQFINMRGMLTSMLLPSGSRRRQPSLALPAPGTSVARAAQPKQQLAPSSLPDLTQALEANTLGFSHASVAVGHGTRNPFKPGRLT